MSFLLSHANLPCHASGVTTSILVLILLTCIGCAGTGIAPPAQNDNLILPSVRLVTSAPAADAQLSPQRSGKPMILVQIKQDNQLLSKGVSDDEITLWIKHNADTLTRFLGRFPVEQININMHRQGTGHISGGSTNPLRIAIRVGSATTVTDLNNDWVMLHEMFHLAFPDTSDELVWFNEGMASYLEPIARVREKNLTSPQVWSEFARGMSQGLPDANDQGLNRTHTWGRVYWGGALFCLQADIQIRKQTQNRYSLDDALRAIVRQGGNNRTWWNVKRILHAGDHATGTHVLTTLYNEQALVPGKVDLAQLWEQLGIKLVHKRSGDQVIFDDNAPLADVRRAITNQQP